MSKPRLLPVVIFISLAGWLLGSYQIFPASRYFAQEFSSFFFTIVVFIALIYFFIISIQLMKKKKVAPFAWDICISGAYVICFFLIIFPLLPHPLPEGSYQMKFEQVLWQDEATATYASGDVTSRQKMVGDVINNILPNKTRTEIIDILGQPTKIDTQSDHLIYVLGFDRGIHPNYFEWLIIQMDGEGFKGATVQVGRRP